MESLIKLEESLNKDLKQNEEELQKINDTLKNNESLKKQKEKDIWNIQKNIHDCKYRKYCLEIKKEQEATRNNYNLCKVLCQKNYKDYRTIDENDPLCYSEKIEKSIIFVVFPKKCRYNLEDIIIYMDGKSGETYKNNPYKEDDWLSYEKYRFSNIEIVEDNASRNDAIVNKYVTDLIFDELKNMEGKW